MVIKNFMEIWKRILLMIKTIVELVKVNFIDGSEIKGTVSNDSKSSGLLLTRMKTYNCLRENPLIHNCNKNISTTSNVTVTKKHNTKKEHKCNVCDKLFPYPSKLIRHTRMHTGEKPYTCAICCNRFSQKSSLTKHSRIHTGEKPYACAFCHKRFSTTTYLKIHIRIHTGEKPYVCDICYKQFNHKSNLRRHTRKHTGEEPGMDVVKDIKTFIENLKKFEAINLCYSGSEASKPIHIFIIYVRDCL
ncbi:gastrula zinc finger protein XlCGF49.1-like [Myzus persicae]|uniref:gastrula zinc finger protein XlCGF49.1-like n=1 Tax=Myzus persicae TaxID=13164 RepID=UPI000B933F57|nr:gastrula zinc finger protein XlCGF49.1-like [Myzus persicae]